jgi:FlgN protein
MSSLKKRNQKLLNEILLTLTEEIALYEDLAQTARNKQEAILSNDLKSLSKYTGLEHAFVRKGNNLTSKRLGMTSDSVNGPKKKILSLASFMALNNLEKNKDWVHKETQLTGVLNNIKRINNENSLLLKTSVRFIQGLINLYYPKNETESKIYTRDGKTETQKKSVVDCGV